MPMTFSHYKINYQLQLVGYLDILILGLKKVSNVRTQNIFAELSLNSGQFQFQLLDGVMPCRSPDVHILEKGKVKHFW